MKIIDNNGVEIASPDLTLGYLKPETQTIHHDAAAGVEEVSHYEYKTYPNGGKDRWKVVDVPGVDPQPAWDEEVPVMRYILYTAEELAQRKAEKKAAEDAKAEAERKKAEQEALPGKLAALQAAQNDADALNVDQEYRLTLLELGISE